MSLPLLWVLCETLKKDGIIIDAIFSSIKPDAIEFARRNNIKIWRTDMRAAVAGEMTTVLRTYNTAQKMGKSYIEGIPIISPTYIGEKGDIVVDSIVNPREVIGISDGIGNIIYDEKEEYSVKINRAEQEIIKREISGKKNSV